MNVEIYGLFDPDTDALRYVGKANNAKARLTKHFDEARRCSRPLHNWLRKLLSEKKAPVLRVLETVPKEQWEEAEKRLIAHYRQSCQLLNVADGGSMPSQTKAQRQKCAKTLNKANADRDPRMKAFIQAKMEYARMLPAAVKCGDLAEAERLKASMYQRALRRPDLYGEWLKHG